MGTTIHQLRAIVTSDISNFVNGMGLAKKSVAELMQSWKNAAAAIASAAQRIVLATTAMSVAATKSFADFEDIMVEVGAISRTLGTKDFEALKQAAIEMGEKTRYSATEAAGGLKELAQSGLTAKQAIEALPHVLNLAVSSGLSIAQSAGIASKLMKAMGIEARELARVNDVLVSTFQRSNTDLTMLSEGLKHAAPLAHTVGVSLEELTAILAKMADAGFQGEMGGTALRNIISRLAGAVPKLQKQFAELGIQTLDANGKMLPLIDILEQIEQKGLSAGKIMELFGQRGGPQLLALLEQGTKGIRQFIQETKNAEGQAAAIQKAKTQTVKGQWDELTSYIETIFNDTGEKIRTRVIELMNSVEQLLRMNRPEIINQMAGATFTLIDALIELKNYVVDNKTAIWEFLKTVGWLISTVAQLISACPQLLAWLITLKVTGFLGLNNAAIQLCSALISTIGYLVGFGTASTAAGAAGSAAASQLATSFGSLAIAGGPISLVLAAVVGLGVAVYQVSAALDDLDRKKDKLKNLAKELQPRMAEVIAAQNENELKHIKSIDDPVQRRVALAENVDRRKESEVAARKFIDATKPGSDEDFEARERWETQLKELEKARAAVTSETDSQLSKEIEAAKQANAVETGKIVQQYEELKHKFETGEITAMEFLKRIEDFSISLRVVARNFDPAIERLYKFSNQLEGAFGADSSQLADYKKFLSDLNSIKHLLGPAQFGQIVNQIGALNAQLANGVISQEEYIRQLNILQSQALKPLQENRTALINQKIKDKEKEDRKAALSEFEDIQNIVGMDQNGDWNVSNLSAESIQAIGNSVEGATPEIVQQLVDNFTELQTQGSESVKEGFDQLILNFLESVEDARNDAEQKAEQNKAALDAYKTGGTYGDVRNYVNKTGGDFASNALYQMFHANQTAVQNGQISADVYADRSRAIGNVAGQSSGAIGDLNDENTRVRNQLEKMFNSSGGEANASKMKGFADNFKEMTERFQKQIKDLTDEFAKGNLTEEQFTEKLKVLKGEFAKASDSAQELIAHEQQLIEKRKSEALEIQKAKMIIAGNFAGAGINPQLMFWQKIAQFQMQNLDNYITQLATQFAVMNGIIPQVNQGFQNVVDGLQKFGNDAGQWFEAPGGGGGGNGIQGGLNSLYNSISGALALANNNISMVAQKLTLKNLPYSKLAEYQKELDYWVAQRDALLSEPPPMFVGSSSDPMFKDPGIIGVGSRNQQTTTNNTMPVTLSFPNINKMTNQNISDLFEQMAREGRRRGIMFNPIT